MKTLHILKPKNISCMLEKMLGAFCENIPCAMIDDISRLPDLKNQKVLFALELDKIGQCQDINRMLLELYARGNDSLSGTHGALLIHSDNELYTKDAARHIIFSANNLGCFFLGHPVVEATGSLNNFLTWQKTIPLSLEEICLEQCRKLSSRLITFEQVKYKNPKILVLHASSRATSNTLTLWNMVKSHLRNQHIDEMNVENGTIQDCAGCSFKTCIHYSKQSSCFYGGIMVKEIMPSIEKADIVVFVCPNYNDAISANLTAVINRLTALYRKMSFYDKSLYSIIVSGNSGSDSVAKQLIGALNVNKGLRLPSYFSIMETANDPNAIREAENIDYRAKTFADKILQNIEC